MNRHERRAASKKKAEGTIPDTGSGFAPISVVPLSDQEIPTAPSREGRRPGLFLRMFAKVLLSNWVVNRVNHPDAEQLLISLAMEAGRPEIADRILRRKASKAL